MPIQPFRSLWCFYAELMYSQCWTLTWPWGGCVYCLFLSRAGYWVIVNNVCCWNFLSDFLQNSVDYLHITLMNTWSQRRCKILLFCLHALMVLSWYFLHVHVCFIFSTILSVKYSQSIWIDTFKESFFTENVFKDCLKSFGQGHQL